MKLPPAILASFIRSLYRTPEDNFPSVFPFENALPWPVPQATNGEQIKGLPALPDGLDVDYLGRERDPDHPIADALLPK